MKYEFRALVEEIRYACLNTSHRYIVDHKFHTLDTSTGKGDETVSCACVVN
jgi:hypothetical protein